MRFLTVVMLSSASFVGHKTSVSSSSDVMERSDMEGMEVKERLVVL